MDILWVWEPSSYEVCLGYHCLDSCVPGEVEGWKRSNNSIYRFKSTNQHLYCIKSVDWCPCGGHDPEVENSWIRCYWYLIIRNIKSGDRRDNIGRRAFADSVLVDSAEEVWVGEGNVHVRAGECLRSDIVIILEEVLIRNRCWDALISANSHLEWLQVGLAWASIGSHIKLLLWNSIHSGNCQHPSASNCDKSNVSSCVDGSSWLLEVVSDDWTIWVCAHKPCHNIGLSFAEGWGCPFISVEVLVVRICNQLLLDSLGSTNSKDEHLVCSNIRPVDLTSYESDFHRKGILPACSDVGCLDTDSRVCISSCFYGWHQASRSRCCLVCVEEFNCINWTGSFRVGKLSHRESWGIAVKNIDNFFDETSMVGDCVSTAGACHLHFKRIWLEHRFSAIIRLATHTVPGVCPNRWRIDRQSDQSSRLHSCEVGDCECVRITSWTGSSCNNDTIVE